MGRTLKRVPLDFVWPLKKLWGGYVNPYYKPCPEDGLTCFNGQSGGREWLEVLLRLLTLAAEEAQYTGDLEAQRRFQKHGRIWPHPYLQDLPTKPQHVVWAPAQPSERPSMVPLSVTTLPLTADLLDLVKRLGGEGPDRVLGFGSGTTWRIEKKLLELAGLDHETWGICPVCHGERLDPAMKQAHDEWRPTEPPTGVGYQLWETTSEGSPLSPVFPTLKELCAYAEDNCSTFGSNYTSAAEWERMLAEDFVVHQEGNLVFV